LLEGFGFSGALDFGASFVASFFGTALLQSRVPFGAVGLAFGFSFSVGLDFSLSASSSFTALTSGFDLLAATTSLTFVDVELAIDLAVEVNFSLSVCVSGSLPLSRSVVAAEMVC